MEWLPENNALVKDYKFVNFNKAITFILQVSEVAETLDHHPKIINEYNKVRLELSTHSAGHTVTEKDRELARRIDALGWEPHALGYAS